MFQAVLTLKPTLTNWLHPAHPSGTLNYDLDGACPACDHPFGTQNHMCFGPVTRTG